MKKILFLTFLFLANICRAADGGEVLWWLVSSTDSIQGTANDGKVYTAADLGVTGARIRYEGNGTSGYLPIIGVDAGGGNNLFDGASGVGTPGWYYAVLGEYTGEAYSYVLELGNWADGNWVGTSMVSEAAGYNYLKDNLHIAEWAGTPPTYAWPWTPTGFTVVPEPTGGLLILVGGALLALRRRKRNVV